ncbi:chromosomal replication initiator DnaA [Falsihalocynthiibacter sp. SS001]|uniref:chromosomal replication initiator DnaA n=1 Tax=Falsihalocynthiibacter sp. SS001 TaxID=3349698 RepID=UPI0036D36E58
MTQQLTLDLPVKTALGREDFFVAPSNTLAQETLAAPQDWPMGKMVLCGASGAGKTHLAHVWAADTGAQIIPADRLFELDIATLTKGPLAVEDADAVAGNAALEQHLFHLHNLMLSNGQYLLLSAQSAPSRWNLALPDLRSRMEGTAVTWIESPDDMLLTVVLLKHFNDLQIHVAPEVVDYIIKRTPRSLGFIRELTDALNQEALREKRPITRVLAGKTLDALDKKHPETA